MTPADPIFITLEKKAPAPLGAYSHAVVAGDFVYLCGLGARSPETGQEVGVSLDKSGDILWYDIEAQTKQALENLKTVLKESGCTLQNLVDVHVFLKDMKDFAKMNDVYGQYFTHQNLPARTTIEATPPGLNFIEVKAIAYKPNTYPDKKV
ncbi:MAG: RidA family protein [Vampirovibrio sp.]|nr:RidA family protein [Vampirovibrio sp.]